MLLPDTSAPWQSSYLLGGIILEHLKNSKKSNASIEELKENLEKKINRSISIETTVLAISWLYLIGLINDDEDGKIKLC